MSWPSDQSPGSRPKNSQDCSQRPGQYGNYRSPFSSPRNGQDFRGKSPIKNFGWRNNSGYHNFQSDRFQYSPGGNRRGGGGHFRGRGRGHFRGSHSDSADISAYVNPSMLIDPWKELEETVGPKLTSSICRNSEASITSTPNSSISTSVNTSVSNNDTKENLTEESIVISDDSCDVVSVSDLTVPHSDGKSAETDQLTPDSSST